MNKVFNVEIDGQITLPDGRKLGPFEETTVNVIQPSECASDPIVENAKQTGGFGYTEQGEQTVITWDGDTEGKVVIADTQCRISDKTPTIDELIGGTYTIKREDGSEDDPRSFNADYFTQPADGLLMYSDLLFIVSKPFNGAGGSITETGIYVILDEHFYVSNITYGTPDTIHKIDEKYLPASGVVFWTKPDPSEHDDGYIRMYHDKECTRIVEIAEFNELLETRPLIWLRQPTGSNEAKLGVGYMPGVIDEDYAGAVRKYDGEVVWTAGEAD